MVDNKLLKILACLNFPRLLVRNYSHKVYYLSFKRWKLKSYFGMMQMGIIGVYYFPVQGPPKKLHFLYRICQGYYCSAFLRLVYQ